MFDKAVRNLVTATFVATLSMVPFPAGAVAPGPSTTVLYDLSQGMVPPTFFVPPGLTGSALAGGALLFSSESVNGLGTTITPASNQGYAGYANYKLVTEITLIPPSFKVGTDGLVNAAFPVLDRNEGFKLTFGFRMLGEDHSGNANRAGFSVTLLDSEHKGVEIGFQSDRIFAQHDGATGPMFTAGENTTSATHVGALSSFNTWELQVNSGGYALTRGGAAVLAGALRDYSAYTGLGEAAYKTPNFLFIGDNTTSAGSTFTLQYLAITTAPVPEPSAYMMLIAGLSLVGAVAFRRRRALATVR